MLQQFLIILLVFVYRKNAYCLLYIKKNETEKKKKRRLNLYLSLQQNSGTSIKNA